MKLTRLESTTARPSSEAVARAQAAVSEQARRVEAVEGIEGDRLRSLRQELAEVDPRALSPLETSQEQLLRDAKQVADEIARLDSAANLVRESAVPAFIRDQIDDKA